MIQPFASGVAATLENFSDDFYIFLSFQLRIPRNSNLSQNSFIAGVSFFPKHAAG